MDNLKFNGVLEEIKNQYPNIDIAQFLQEKLQLPDYKAEELATRIKKEYFQKTTKEPEQKTVRTILQKTYNPEAPAKTSSYSVDCLSEMEFEFFVKWLFEELGYEIHQEKHSTHLGVDLVAIKDGETFAVLARRYPKICMVSEAVVLISHEVKRIYGCQKSIVLITAYFTQQAIADAQKSNVELWNRESIESKINEVIRKSTLRKQPRFPQYYGSLLQSLLKFEETENFIIEPKTGGKFDLHLSGIKFPLLTFQTQADKVIRCVFRIKNNNPVGEHEGTTLISHNQENNRVGPNEIQAYALIIQYLEEFLT
jgi:HJR/Mrr/RecB family endonuclease